MLTDNKFAKQINNNLTKILQYTAESFKSANPINNAVVAGRSNQKKPRDT